MSTEDAILTFLSTSPDAVIPDTHPWAASNNLDHAKVVGAIKSLLVEEYVAVEDLKTSFYSLTKEGESIVANGSQEFLVLKALNEAGKLSMPDLQAKVGKDVAKIGMGNCMKAKWIKKDGGDLVPLKKDDEVEDSVQKILLDLKAAGFKPDAVPDKVRTIIFAIEVLEIVRKVMSMEKPCHFYAILLQLSFLTFIGFICPPTDCKGLEKAKDGHLGYAKIAQGHQRTPIRPTACEKGRRSYKGDA